MVSAQGPWGAAGTTNFVGKHGAPGELELLVRSRTTKSHQLMTRCHMPEEGGRPAFDPQLLISLWVYAYSQGIGSAREVARRCEYDPA
jgi:transposase